MKYITGFLLPLLFTTNILAADLCESSCDLTITFPDGGSIKSDDDLEIIFGTGGYITNNGVTTGYSNDDEIEVEDDEPLIFQAGGKLVLGSGGNIKYSDMTITSNGVINLAAVGDKKKVKLSDVTLLGDLTLNMSSNFTVSKRRWFYIESGSAVAVTDLEFRNDGYVYGQFVFGDAILIQGDTESAFSGEIFLDSYRKFKIISVVPVEEPVIEEPPVVEPPEVIQPPVVIVDTGGELAVADSTTSDSTSGAVEPTAHGVAGGFINMLSLMVISSLLLFVRRLQLFNQ